MMLKQILDDCDYMSNNIDMERDISGIAYDSRNVKNGYLFVAIKGEKVDGHDFIEDAGERGAVAVVCERNYAKCNLSQSEMNEESNPGLSLIHVNNSRTALACIANNFYERPSEKLTLIGITGTNGKTTTTYLLKSILESWGRHVGLIGTIQYMIKDRVCPALHTTPESLEFQRLLREMFLSGCTHVISEVSSHALAQYRVDKAVFHTAVFTNLTRDHLDFHNTMEGYFKAKERLFTKLLDDKGTVVLNADDPYGRRLGSELKTAGNDHKNILTYGLGKGADISAGDIDNSILGLSFKLSFKGENFFITSPLMGLPNVYNILSAVGASILLGVPWEAILEGIAKTGNIPGRFERVDAGQKFLCVIDYAHTEDALERLISAARELIASLPPHLAKGGHEGGEYSTLAAGHPRIITVFGCGGDRDRGKRPVMGAVATRLSDVVIITSDNPRSEEPSAIIKDIEEGAVRGNYIVETDRRKAIVKAVEMADDDDIILIAGKGHEDYQEIKGVRFQFSDRDELTKAIKDKSKIDNT
jgi:UDP-N-acetylmuramoyl-L-alanyl-D-glutamate--2,6-diaminopimelate ligase